LLHLLIFKKPGPFFTKKDPLDLENESDIDVDDDIDYADEGNGEEFDERNERHTRNSIGM
jgi:hypothetical protein